MKYDESLMVVEDPLNRIQFWVDLLRTDGLSTETKRLVDKCLQNELRQYIEPLRLTITSDKAERLNEGE